MVHLASLGTVPRTFLTIAFDISISKTVVYMYVMLIFTLVRNQEEFNVPT